MEIEKEDTTIESGLDLHKCYLRKSVANEERDLKKHALDVHWIEKSPCSECEHGAEDTDILVKHMKKHTEGTLLSCY